MSSQRYGAVLSETARPGKGPIMRHKRFRAQLQETWDVATLHEAWMKGVTTCPLLPCLGTRQIAAAGVAGPFKFVTYSEANTRAVNIGRGLMELRLITPQPATVRLDRPDPNFDLSGKCMIGLYSANCPEWVLCEQAANHFSVCTIPLYDTHGPDACKYIIDLTQMSLVCCSRFNTATLLESVGSCLKIILQFETATPDEVAVAQRKGIRLLSLEEVEACGREHPVASVSPSPDMLATICFTSGTTGDPKGAMLTHRNIIADAAGVMSVGLQLEQSDVHLSYLPLAHMLERMVQVCMWRAGGAVGFFRGDVLGLMDDICELKPTIFPSVPRLFNRLYDKVISASHSSGMFKSKIFNAAYDIKLAELKTGWVENKFWDPLVFKAVKSRLGGRVRVIITGSAPIAPHVLDFLRVCFSCHVLEGYGQTECGAVACMTNFGDTSTGHVGGPISTNEIRLEDVPEMNYSSASDPPRGEICIRGGNVFVGYWRDAEKTHEAIDEQGWLHSGDIGELLPNGAIRIIDRKKNIFKLAQGEYIAPEKIESIYLQSPFVHQCFVHGDSLQATLVAIVVVDPEATKEWLSENGHLQKTDSSDSTKVILTKAIKMEAFEKVVYESMKAAGTQAKLRGFEAVKAIHCEATPFSVENGLLTPTFKLKRMEARMKYRKEIDDMYAELAPSS